MEFPEVTSHAILLDETRTRILLIKWRNPSGQKVWGFPGGHIKIGEKVRDAVIREVEEETGYQIEVNWLLGVYDNIVRDVSSKKIIAHIINIVWMAKVVSGTLDFRKDEEIIRARWFPFASAKKLRMSPNARRILYDAFSIVVDEAEKKGGCKGFVWK